VLQQAGCERIFQEKRSGTIRDRAELGRLLDQLRTGDTIVVWKLDRMARLQSLSEAWADTAFHVGKLIMTVLASIAEFERDVIPERTRAGRLAAKRRGLRFGRPPKRHAEQQALARRLLSEGMSVKKVAGLFGVHVATIYRLADADST